MIHPDLLKQARGAIALYFRGVLQEKGVSIYDVAKVLSIQPRKVRAVIDGGDYDINTFLSLCCYFDTHIDLMFKSTKNSIINHMGGKISDN